MTDSDLIPKLRSQARHADMTANTIAVLREECDRLQAAKRRALAIADERSKENVGLRAQVKMLRAALEFYANLENYRSDLSRPVVSTGAHRASPVESDCGQRAAFALNDALAGTSK